MSQENVETFKRALDAFKRRDTDAFLEAFDPEVEWHAAMERMLGGEARVYRGHGGVREWLRELDEAFSEVHLDLPDIQDLGDQLVAIGHMRARGRASGAVIETPLSYLTDHTNGKIIRVRAYLDPKEVLEAAGLSE